MAELWSVLTHVFDSRADLTPLQGKSSVQTRQGGCVLGTCLLTSIWFWRPWTLAWTTLPCCINVAPQLPAQVPRIALLRRD